MERLARPSLSEELLGAAPDGYYERKIESMQAGEVVWVRRNFDGDAGQCIDLFRGTHHLGYVAGWWADPYRPANGFVFSAYINSEEGPELLDPEAAEKPTAAEVAAFDLFQFCRRQGLLDTTSA